MEARSRNVTIAWQAAERSGLAEARVAKEQRLKCEKVALVGRDSTCIYHSKREDRRKLRVFLSRREALRGILKRVTRGEGQADPTRNAST